MVATPVTSRWSAEAVAAIGRAPFRTARPIGVGDVRKVRPGLDIWDQWPVQERDGAVARFGGGELWISLSAPASGDPIARHGAARLRLLARAAGVWTDLGNLLPDGFSPGSREWSGSAVADADHRRITVFFTAAGRRGEPTLSYEQRLFQTRASVSAVGGSPRLARWTRPRECVASDGRLYDLARQSEGQVGQIKAFRDPAHFHDPADGADYLLFAASLPPPSSVFNGAVGLARAAGPGLERWSLLPPILQADGVNNELERPHVIFRDGLYYLFWSTQAEVFAPDGPVGPTGLYGMVAPALAGPYEPLNGTGLVFANPPQAPFQAYSWLVDRDLGVTSFVNYRGVGGPHPPEGEAARSVFGGAPAPVQRIRLDGARTW